MQPAAQLGGKKDWQFSNTTARLIRVGQNTAPSLQSWESFCCDNIFGIPEWKEHCTFSSVCECREKSTPVEVNIHDESKRYFVVPFAIYHSEPSTQTHTERVEKISGSQKLPSKTWKSWHYHWNATWALALEKQWPIKIIDCHLAAPKKKKKFT